MQKQYQQWNKLGMDNATKKEKINYRDLKQYRNILKLKI